MRTLLGDAICLATVGHHDITDKGGNAYILHPMRMMMRLRSDDEELNCIAILHDIIEDTVITLEQLLELEFTQRIVDGVDGMTRRDGESYDDFIVRCGQNPDSRRVKIEDLRDNSDITRLKGLRPKDHERMEKYSKAFIYLKEYNE